MRLLPIPFLLCAALAAAPPFRTETRTEPLAMGANLRITQGDGKVEIKGWDRPEVQLVAEFETGRMRGEAKLEVRRVADGLEIEVDRMKRRRIRFLFFGRYHDPVCNLTLMVPRRLNVEVRTVDGAVGIQELEGYAGCRTVDGPIRLQDISGEVHARAVDGTITARNLKARIKGGTVDGNIALSQVEGGVDVHSVDGSITAEGLDGWGEGLAFRTVDGSIKVKLGQAKGNLEAKAVDGRVRANLPGAVYAGNKRNRFTCAIPGRDQKITFRTVDGNIDIE
ncbi:DUF4097 family beta strand repeat-containing protein [Mesoterricola silvestris]|uniref:DUF4097 domain-containing protein n=1 Tax=Mesoterricola silvestris TaxID=2927979 RepID=A0AA48K7R1_9BACT|nr:DUF4097 family beta strand repeat-containing protein [Mesoterricola silvestris]BDU71375.1 hypothetical protein METEAL_05490 [Mesoterricola silvestris]